jgi:hypothetical protein
VVLHHVLRQRRKANDGVEARAVLGPFEVRGQGRFTL